jgi:hypothetical protein
MAGAGNLEEDLLLALEQDFAVVHAAGKIHQPVDFDHLLRVVGVGDQRLLPHAIQRRIRLSASAGSLLPMSSSPPPTRWPIG